MRFDCERCGAHLEAEAGDAGQVMECPSCHQAITVPEPIRVNGAELRRQLRSSSERRVAAASSSAPHVSRNGIAITDISVPFPSVLALCFKVLCAQFIILLPFIVIGFMVGAVGGCMAALR